MKRLDFLVLLAVASCSRPTAESKPGSSLSSAQEASFERGCTKDGEPNTAGSGLGIDVTVRTPNLGPNDVVDVGNQSFSLEGRVHDCATDRKVLAVVTGSEVVLLDPTKDAASAIDHGGRDRVAVGPRWIAWSLGSVVQARRR